MLSDTVLRNTINIFITNLQRKQIKGAYHIGRACADIMRTIVSSMTKKDTVQQVIDQCRLVAVMLKQAQPTMFVIGNVVRRVLYIIRDEYAQSNSGTQQTVSADSLHQPNLANLLEAKAELDYTKPVEGDFKANILSEIKELISELDNMNEGISEVAIEHVHSNEVILTIGQSHTVEHFLKVAAEKKKKFEVVVTEHAPSYSGHELVKSLSEKGISATLISDAAAFAIMSRVNKVIVGTHSVMANGGLIAPSGTHLVALAAKKKSVPFVVCCGLYKLTPMYPLDQDSFNDLCNPSEVIPPELYNLKDAHVLNPCYDYVPPELIDLFIMNETGTHNPQYIYRVLAEYYDTRDYDLGVYQD
ncbi:translation initiation factor eIF-2B subunit bet [Acrasis kona]|uniref:Translation initiation factor eIF2B subunit beta n=1 Tax=Acrasis kona TaxID=1008807 RepID=A0AAW2Z880_9EUKA